MSSNTRFDNNSTFYQRKKSLSIPSILRCRVTNSSPNILVRFFLIESMSMIDNP